MLSRDRLLDLQLVTLQLKLDVFVHDFERRYSPDQPRVPAGRSDGGQWTSDGGGSLAHEAGRNGPPNASRRSVRIALGARLIGKRFGLGGDRVIVHCYYRDMLGNDFTIEPDATLEGRPTWPARAGG